MPVSWCWRLLTKINTNTRYSRRFSWGQGGRLPDGTLRASEGGEFCFLVMRVLHCTKTACILGSGSGLSRLEWEVSIQMQVFWGSLYPSRTELASAFCREWESSRGAGNALVSALRPVYTGRLGRRLERDVAADSKSVRKKPRGALKSWCSVFSAVEANPSEEGQTPQRFWASLKWISLL